MDTINSFADNIGRVIQRFLFTPAGPPAPPDAGTNSPPPEAPHGLRGGVLSSRDAELRAVRKARALARKRNALKWLRRQRFLDPELIPPSYVYEVERLTAAVSKKRKAARSRNRKSKLSGGTGSPRRPSSKRKLTRAQRRRAVIRAARRAAKSGTLAQEIFGDGKVSAVVNDLYSLPCEQVDKAPEVERVVRDAIYARAEELRKTWTKNHEIKANNYHLPPLAYEPLTGSEAGFGGGLKESFE